MPLSSVRIPTLLATGHLFLRPVEGRPLLYRVRHNVDLIARCILLGNLPKLLRESLIYLIGPGSVPTF